MSSDSSDRRLSSWKEIGAFFGKDERTVKRWEAQRGLPVHRIPGGARTTVYAYAGELDRWLKSVGSRPGAARTKAAAEPPAAETDTIPDRTAAAVRTAVKRALGAPRILVLAAAPLALLLIVLLAMRLGSFQSADAQTAGQVRTQARFPAEVRARAPEIVDLYLTGIYHWEKRTPESLNRAVHYFNQAIARDPNYAEAYVGLANCYNLLREYTLMPAEEAYPRARAAAERAIALDDTLADAHTSLAFVEFYWTRDVERARSEFERARELDPASVRVHHWYATALLHMGEFQHSLAEITKAQMLEPASRSILADKGLILFYAGQPDEALRLLKQLAEAEPDYLSPHAYLAAIYFARREYRDYFRKARQAAQLLEDANRLSIIKAAERGFAASGEAGLLQAMLDEQEKRYSDGLETAYALAQTYSLMRETGKALDYLRTAIERREQYILGIRIDPAFAELHSNEAFKRLVVEVGMPGL